MFGYDDFGNPICEPDFGDRNSSCGWEVDHIVPRSAGGTDHLSNLRPLQWRKNASMGGTIGNALAG